MAVPFILMDLALRFFARGIHYFRPTAVFPAIMFTVIWIALIIGIVVMTGGWVGRIIYLVIFAAFFTMYLANAIYTNSLSFSIVNNNPQIEQLFREWEQNEPEAFQSALDRNTDLKQTVMEGTPWLNDAVSEEQ